MRFNASAHPFRPLLASCIAAALFLAAAPAHPAGEAAADPILVQRGAVALRQSDFDAEMQRVPEKDRAAFLSSERRVRDVIERMMMTLELAEAAKAKGIDKEPRIARRVELEQDRVLADAYLRSVEANARSEFDAKGPAVETLARQSYLANNAKYSKPETVTISQITFRIDGSSDAAKARADAAYARIRAGTDIGDIAQELAGTNPTGLLRGVKGPVTRADLDPEVAAVVFGAAKVGEVNPPVRTAKNWSIVRVNERTPGSTRTYDEVKGSIIELMRDEYVSQARDAALAALGAGQKSVVNEAAIEALRTPVPSAKN